MHDKDSHGFQGGQGAGTARLTRAKADIEIHLARPELSAAWLAGRQGITQRHLRRLFEGEGWSLSRYVTARRLEWAYDRLSSQGDSVTIAAVAFEAGFGDLSYFNRCFQRHFGARPSEIRRMSGQVAG